MELHSLALKALADASVRSLVLALAALAAMWLTRARSAPVRHAVWTAVVCAMLLLPLLSVALPSIPLRILPAAPQIALAPAPVEVSGPAPIQAAFAPAPPRPQWDWTSLALPLWLLVASASLGRLVFGYAVSRRLLRGSTPIRDPRVSDALERLGATPAPALGESESISVPLTLGWIEPYILLPLGWRDWDRAKMEAVLAHEIAHVRRSDWLVAVLAGVNRSLFWFHPLAWWMERRLIALAEEACDESSLEATGNRKRYAEVLLEMAEAVRTANGRLTSHAVAMARRSQVRQRIETILDESRHISRGMTKARWAAVLLCAVPLVWGAAAIQLQSAPAQTPAPSASAAPKTLEAAVEQPKLIRRVSPEYPPLARQAGVTGTVRVEAVIGLDGRVRKAMAIQGPTLLRRPAEQAVMKWVFEPALRHGEPVEAITQVDVHFTLQASLRLEVERSEGQLLLKWNDEGDLLPDAQRATLTIIDGDHTQTLPLDLAQLRSGSFPYAPITGEVEFRLEVVSRQGKSASASARVLAGQLEKRAEEVEVGAQTAVAVPEVTRGVPAGKVISRVPPVYPPLALQARVSGVVRVAIVIGADGRVKKAAAVSGPPLLRRPAVEAIQQWVFEPALIDHKPVAVATEIDVSFTLPTSLELKVERSQGQLVLHWNRDADGLRDAHRATLTIIDGDHTDEVALDPGQLRSGSMVYAPISNDVQFRLEVASREGKSVSGSVRVLSGQLKERAEEAEFGTHTKTSGPGATSAVLEAKVISRVPPVYPPLARQARVTGTVRVEATIGVDGRVRSAAAISGPPLLRQAAVEAVRQWVYEPGRLNGVPVEVTTQVDLAFTLPTSLALTVERSAGQLILRWNRHADVLRDADRATLTITDGDHTEDLPVDLGQLRSGSFVYAPMTGNVHFRLDVVSREGKIVSESLRSIPVGDGPVPGGTRNAAPPAPARIRVGGNVQAANLIDRVDPIYPPLARQARIQGLVRFTAILGTDGHVLNLQIISGHPLLVPAAQEAVQQWVYRPTMLNGNPVEVVTQIEVNFTLPE